MNTMTSGPDPRELLISFLILRLRLLTEQQWLEQIRNWSPEASSFGELLRDQEILSTKDFAAVARLADTLLEDTQDASQQMARFSPPESLLRRLARDSSCQSWLPWFMDITQSIKGQTTLDEDSVESIELESDLNETTQDSVISFADEQVAKCLNASERYEVLHTHAEGGLGRVSLAEDRELHRKVALKQIKTKATTTARQRFVFEAQVTGYLEHPGIVPVYSFANDESGHPFYTMRFVDGDTLADAIKQLHRKSSARDGSHSQEGLSDSATNRFRGIEFRQLLNRFVDLCNAIDYAHHRGIIHRDLKPSNVMLGQFGETLVVDWGLARKIGSDVEFGDAADETIPDDGFRSEAGNVGATQPGAVVGTPAFMSPEQARGVTDQLTTASDIYSLGSILYVILTGQKAYQGKQVTEIIEKVRAGDFSTPRDLDRSTPSPLNAICLKAMSANPKDRYQTARELADDIDRWLADEPVVAWPEPIATRIMRWMKNHRVTVASSVVGLLIAIVSMGVILGIQRSANQRLTEANVRERAATDEAEQQFDLALSAIQKYHDDVASDFLLGQSEFRSLRESLLRAPREFYAQLTQVLEQKPNPSRSQRIALYDAHVQLGGLAEELAAYEDGIASYNKAEQIIRDLLIDFPRDGEIAEDYVRSQYSLAFLHGAIGNADDAERALGNASDLLEEYEPDDDEEQSWSFLRASLLRRRATLLSSQSRADEAIANYEESVEIRRSLLGEEVTNQEETSKLAGTLNDFGNLLSSRGRVPDAEAAMRESASLLEVLVKEQPEKAFDTYRLASTYTNLAYLCQATKRTEEAIEIYQKSEPLFRQLTNEGSNIVVFQSGLASTLNNLGLLYADRKDFERAEAYYLEAISIKEQLVASHPLSVDYRVSLGGGYSNFGGFKFGMGDMESAITWFTRSVETLTQVLQDNPDQATATAFIRSATVNRARTLRKIDRHLQAAEDFLAASKLEADPRLRRPFLNQHAQSLALGGDHRGAIEATEALESNAVSDKDYFDLAFVYALAVTAAEEDNGLDDESKGEVIKGYTDRAVKALRAMNETGRVPPAVFQNLLNSNEFLDPLRGQAGFEQLRQEFDL